MAAPRTAQAESETSDRRATIISLPPGRRPFHERAPAGPLPWPHRRAINRRAIAAPRRLLRGTVAPCDPRSQRAHRTRGPLARRKVAPGSRPARTLVEPRRPPLSDPSVMISSAGRDPRPRSEPIQRSFGFAFHGFRAAPPTGPKRKIRHRGKSYQAGLRALPPSPRFAIPNIANSRTLSGRRKTGNGADPPVGWLWVSPCRGGATSLGGRDTRRRPSGNIRSGAGGGGGRLPSTHPALSFCTAGPPSPLARAFVDPLVSAGTLIRCPPPAM